MVEGWTDFFVATAGAGAALVGLIIVAMSVNISTILSISGMTSRAAATIGSMVLLVISAVAALIPGQPIQLLGAEILVFGLFAAILAVDAGTRVIRNPPPGWAAGGWVRAFIAIAQILPFLAGGVLLVVDVPAGLYWVAAGTLAVFVCSVANTWVLLVEILR